MVIWVTHPKYKRQNQNFVVWFRSTRNTQRPDGSPTSSYMDYCWLHWWKHSPLESKTFKSALLKVVGIGSTFSGLLVKATLPSALVLSTLVKGDITLYTVYSGHILNPLRQNIKRQSSFIILTKIIFFSYQKNTISRYLCVCACIYYIYLSPPFQIYTGNAQYKCFIIYMTFASILHAHSHSFSN